MTAELECIQELHFWKVVTIDADHIRLAYGATFEVVIPCIQYRAGSKFPAISVLPTEQRVFENFPDYRELMARLGEAVVREQMKSNMGYEQVMNLRLSCSVLSYTKSRLFNYWTTVGRR
jgi:hypothetical protein